ncbi:type I restriction enzyme HsdR N-terminal domain-containing protein [Pseudoduganella sp. LjRoot289]|uniref:hypothetical protein n=1 Tax=Pseudoduganella sp. LjRoot289 TaxID=3342314 RepID=UPI003ECDD4E4
MFENFDFTVLNDPNYKEDSVREDLISPLLKELGYQPTGKQRMQRSQSLPHPFVMIGSQKRKIQVIPDYTLFHEDQAILILDAKRPSEAVVQSQHVEQAFSYAIHPEIRTKSYALCNGHELVLYDIDRAGPVFLVKMAEINDRWNDVLKHFSPVALLNHSHRAFQPDLGFFLKNAGFDQVHDFTFIDARITSLGHTAGGVLTATASPEMIEGMAFAGSFDMPLNVLPSILSCLPREVGAMVSNALSNPRSIVHVGGVIAITLTAQLGVQELGSFQHDPLIPLMVKKIQSISRVDAFKVMANSIPAHTLNLPTILSFV